MFKGVWLNKKGTQNSSARQLESLQSEKKKLLTRKLRERKRTTIYTKQIKETSGNQRAAWKILNDLMGNKSHSTKIKKLKIANWILCNYSIHLASEIRTVDGNVNPLNSPKKSYFCLRI